MNNPNENNNQKSDAVKEYAKKKAKDQIRKMAEKKGLATALAPVLFWAAIIIVIIILLTGITAFLLTAPGMVTGKLKEYSTDVAWEIASFFGADIKEKNASDKNKYKVLDYLETMGYDLKGYGFIDRNVDNEDNSNYDETQGVIRDPDTGKIKEGNSHLVELYLMSDAYVYTVKNFNPVSGNGFWNDLLMRAHQISRVISPMLARTIDYFIDKTNWGDGLISIYFEGATWEPGQEYTKSVLSSWFGAAADGFDFVGIKVDPEKKQMSIRRGWGKNYYSYPMDGWTGRYGMPLEFLLSVQIATLKPDLAYEMATGFKTDVQILLRNISNGSITAAYKTDGGYVTYDQIDQAINFSTRFDGSWVDDFLDWLDTRVITEGEKAKLAELGIDGYSNAEIKGILDALREANQYNFQTYIPFISKVTDHWYRDVYFVVKSDNVGKSMWVQSDLDYEALTNERWTNYEKYTEDDPTTGAKAGDYKLYVFDDPSGKYEKGSLFPGSQELAASLGVKVEKKADTLSINEMIKKGLVEGEEGELWSAYETKDMSSGTYRQLYPDESTGYRSKLYYYETLGGSVKQVNDAVRKETNPKIKEMFLSRKYFTYDGTAPTAEKIMKLRKQIRGLSGSYKDFETDSNNKSFSDYEYGAIPEKILDKTFNVDGQQIKLDDITSTVSLNQDSLAAFAMLENTHTEDADFIYRDFKELIVELGFFQKEDLTEGSAKLLAWFIPEIGSYKYPKRNLDKRETLIGTLAHARDEYLVYEKTLPKDQSGELYNDTEGGAMSEEIKKEEEESQKRVDEKNKKKTSLNITNKVIDTFAYNAEKKHYSANLNLENNRNVTDTVAGDQISKNFEECGWDRTLDTVEQYCLQFNHNTARNFYKNKAEYEEWMNELGGVFAKYGGEEKKGRGDGRSLTEAAEFVYGLFWLCGFDYCAYCNNADYDFGRCTPILAHNSPYTAYPDYSGTPHHPHDGGVTRLIDACMVNYDFCTNCNYTVDKIYYKAGLMGGKGQPGGSCSYKSLVNEFGAEPKFEISDLHFGDLIECFATNGGNSINPDDWDGWYHVMYVGEETASTITIYQTGHDFTNDGDWRWELDKSAPRSEMPAQAGWVGLHLWDLKYGVGEEYKGYNGNEAVVSPVTGILLDYGTYDDEDVANDYRRNYDKPDKVDKVGYAKILVLTDELADQIVKVDNDPNSNASVSVTTPKDEKEFEKGDWSETEKALYGYSIYANEYEKAKVATDTTGTETKKVDTSSENSSVTKGETSGIAGYIIYMDGFKAEIPNADGDPAKWDDDAVGSPASASSFDELPIGGYKLSYDGFKKMAYTNGEKLEDEDNYQETFYEPNEVFKLVSDKYTEKLKALEKGKSLCAPLYKFNGYLDGEKKEMILIKEGTVLGRTMCNAEYVKSIRKEEFIPKKKKMEMILNKEVEDNLELVEGNYIRIVFKNRDDEVVENVEDYLKLDTGLGAEDKAGDQPYEAQEGDLELLASLIHHENCVGASSYLGEEDAERASKATGYVCVNRALVNFGNHGTTIRDQIAAPGQYATKDVVLNETTYCDGCLEMAEWDLTYDCNSITNPGTGEEMTRSTVFQAGFCQCSGGKYHCWWVCDNARDGSSMTEYPARPWDTFYCKSPQYEGYP